jgi:hypothetical protein
MDINRQPEFTNPEAQAPKPLEWTWVTQRQDTEGAAASIWKFGFIAPDGAEVRVTFHQVGDVEKQQQAAQEKKGEEAQAQMGMGMPPALDPTAFEPAGQPDTDQTEDATFYATFFSNRHPEFFMKWDTSLQHEDSLTTWITITHGIIDFMRKAKPANLILDDLANGKLKMILRSVAMDVAAANPEYEIEQTQKHHYRSFYQIKKKGSMSAFGDVVRGKEIEGQTTPPNMPSPITGPQQQEPQEETPEGVAPKETGDKTEDPTQPQPEEDPNAFPSKEEVPIKQTPIKKKGLTIEIGKDYSIAVKDKEGNALDRYRGKSPADILRWINAKGYGSNKMVIVDAEDASNPTIKNPPEKAEKKAEGQVEQFSVLGKCVRMPLIPPKQAALMNYIINAESVRLESNNIIFEFQTNKDMNFKRALVELAYHRTNN